MCVWGGGCHVPPTPQDVPAPRLRALLLSGASEAAAGAGTAAQPLGALQVHFRAKMRLPAAFRTTACRHAQRASGLSHIHSRPLGFRISIPAARAPQALARLP